MTDRNDRSNQSDQEQGWDQTSQSPRQHQQFNTEQSGQAGGYEDISRARDWGGQQGSNHGSYTGGDYGEQRSDRAQRDDYGSSRFGQTGQRDREFGHWERGNYGSGRSDHDRSDYGRSDYGRPGQGGYQQDRSRDLYSRSNYGAQGRFDRDRTSGWSQGGDWQDRSQRGGVQSRGYYRGSGYGDESYGSGRFESFTGNDFGGRDFTGGSNALRGGAYATSYGRPGDHNEYSGWREYGESRGFMARAGDEIASWFGDEDAARRRQQDHSGRGPEGYTRSDERIREDVNDALTRDWAVDATRINAKVENGEVTLEGTVPSRTAKRKAEDCAEEVTGVKHVQNNLRVQDHDAGSSLGAGSIASGSSSANTTAGSSALGGAGVTGSTATRTTR